MNINNLEFQVRDTILTIDIGYEEGLGIYGSSFWNGIAQGTYEKTTFDFIDSLAQKEFDVFVDIGAATGCMSLYAASRALKVLSIEPQAPVYEALSRNLVLNPLISQNVTPIFALVASNRAADSIQKSFTPGAAGPIADIGLSGHIVTLIELIEICSQESKIAVKIDIEGAEFPLFADRETRDFLRKRKPLIYIALHPGFKKPLDVDASYFSRMFWRIQAIYDVFSFYFQVTKVGKIQSASRKKNLSLVRLMRALVRDEKDFLLIF